MNATTDCAVAAPRVLILTYAFPPQNRISALRPYKMAAEFDRAGWDVTVLCSEFTGASDGWKADLDWLRLEKYSPSWLSRSLAQSDKPAAGLLARQKTLVKKGARRLFLPEHSWLLRRVVARRTMSLLEEGRFDCLVTISYPFVLHSVGREAKRRWPGLTWVADNRDVWHGNPYRGLTVCPSAIELAIERRLLGAADLVTFAAYSPCETYEARHGLKRVLPVLNGYEQGLHSGGRTPHGNAGEIHVVHTGSLYGGKRDVSPLLDALAIVAKRTGKLVVLDLYGEGSKVPVGSHGPAEGVSIRHHGKVDRAMVYRIQLSADFLVVVMAPVDFDRTYVPGKVFEYAPSGVPVVALCHVGSDLYRVVNENALGVASFDSAEIAQYMVDQVSVGASAAASRPDSLGARHQFGKLIAAVDGIRNASASSDGIAGAREGAL